MNIDDIRDHLDLDKAVFYGAIADAGRSAQALAEAFQQERVSPKFCLDPEYRVDECSCHRALRDLAVLVRSGLDLIEQSSCDHSVSRNLGESHGLAPSRSGEGSVEAVPVSAGGSSADTGATPEASDQESPLNGSFDEAL